MEGIRKPDELKRKGLVGSMRYFRTTQEKLLKRDVEWLEKYNERIAGGQSLKIAAIGTTAVIYGLKTAMTLVQS